MYICNFVIYAIQTHHPQPKFFVHNSVSMWAPLLAIIPVSETVDASSCCCFSSDLFTTSFRRNCCGADDHSASTYLFFLQDFDFPTTSTTTWEIDPPKCPRKKFRSRIDMVLLCCPTPRVGPTYRGGPRTSNFWEGTWERRWDRVYELLSIIR